MKNVTISLDDETHRRARIRAAERGKSLSGLVRDLLVEEASPGSGAGDEQQIRRSLAALRTKVPAGFRAENRLSRDDTHRRR